MSRKISIPDERRSVLVGLSRNGLPSYRYADKETQKKIASKWYRARKLNHPEALKEQSRRAQERSELRRAGRPRPAHCECCGEPGGDRRPHKLHLDHDHATGLFRGWICSHCNLALGHAKDSVETLRKLIECLDKLTKGESKSG